MTLKKTKGAKAIYLRNAVFGVEDSLVSTVGLLAGVAIANVSRETILLSGLVLLSVEAFSMATGSFITENTVSEFFKPKNKSIKRPILGGLVMFVSYYVAGLVPLAPYFFWQSQVAFYVSIFATLLALFILGLVSAHFAKINIYLNGIKVLFVGGLAVVLGVVVGKLFSL